MQRGGRLFYVGAGTSGRLGVLDASECPPTYNVPATLVQGLMAGGDAALRLALEDVEDDPAAGEADLREHGVDGADAVVGIATSGRTPYVLGALGYARQVGALTVALSCAPGSPVAVQAEMAITPVVGAEVVTGSTRMKAGTATKMVLNMLSTGAMVRLGHVYSNLMVNVQPTNEKLLARARRIVALIAEVDAERAAELLEEAGSVKAAIVMEKLGLGRAEAEALLAEHLGHLRRTLGAAAS
jgi:N-acetylmuramic acid 6-phosphate etherase